jgi:hypothetical protein
LEALLASTRSGQRNSIENDGAKPSTVVEPDAETDYFKETTMRTTLLGLAALTAAFAFDAARANVEAYPVYPWCAYYSGRGGTNCYFANLWQCQQAVSGVGGYCGQNPFYSAYGGAAPARRAKRRYRQY